MIEYVTQYHNITCHFIGNYDINKEYSIGDICINPNGEYILYTSQKEWSVITVSPYGDYVVNYKEKEKKFIYPHICKRCGASLNSNICEYCGTNYYESE